jgi:hypothetical protein
MSKRARAERLIGKIVRDGDFGPDPVRIKAVRVFTLSDLKEYEAGMARYSNVHEAYRNQADVDGNPRREPTPEEEAALVAALPNEYIFGRYDERVNRGVGVMCFQFEHLQPRPPALHYYEREWGSRIFYTPVKARINYEVVKE